MKTKGQKRQIEREAVEQIKRGIMTTDLVEQIQKLAREQHEGDFGRAARAYFRDHPSEWAAYRDESSVRVGKQAEDPGSIAAEVHYATTNLILQRGQTGSRRKAESFKKTRVFTSGIVRRRAYGSA